MSDQPIQVTATVVGAAQVEAKFLYSRDNAQEVIKRRINSLTIKLQRRVKEQKLSGQVLNVRSGRLRRSINQQVVIEGSSVVGTVGTNVKYGAYWEQGFEVKAHSRNLRFRINQDGQSRFSSLKNANFEQTVEIQGRTMAARPFLRPSLNEMRAEIQLELARAALMAVA